MLSVDFCKDVKELQERVSSESEAGQSWRISVAGWAHFASIGPTVIELVRFLTGGTWNKKVSSPPIHPRRKMSMLEGVIFYWFVSVWCRALGSARPCIADLVLRPRGGNFFGCLLTPWPFASTWVGGLRKAGQWGGNLFLQGVGKLVGRNSFLLHIVGKQSYQLNNIIWQFSCANCHIGKMPYTFWL